ncbi:uncharacterized protein LOC102809855 [Saccoglossus kowalevskii]|uniref:Uncharacterized protein LOC102809855 n=1 Tax=Saccoglossus kowalevskii TaxID=10224 RepID=A0ABM0MUR2_SACKO|nr:PREDICTED: uncharacterized protein LOC102809855 [Saccoglossus kowalevskii]
MLRFRIELKDNPLTRRGILSTVASSFDPLGFISPCLLEGKKILQSLCRDGHHWDDPVPDEICIQWSKWRNQLPELTQFYITRCEKPEGLQEPIVRELHHFSDASQNGYGSCSYLRIIDSNGKIYSTLLMAKSRVTPTKQLTIPRLELTAAVTAVKISEFLKRELDYDAKHIFWTDNAAHKFHIFVANRIQQIRNHTESNPADVASRGSSVDDLLNHKLWWTGPVFLQSSDPLPLNTGSCTTALNTDDPEVKKSVVLSTQSIKTEPASFLQRLDYFSDWHRMKKSVALCIRYMQRLRSRSIPLVSVSPITVEELQHAEQLILKELQAAHFAEEHHSLSKKLSRLKGNSQLRKLDPYLAPDGLIHVGGRVRRANLPPNLKHPVVLPSRSHITSVLVRHHHKRTAHAGRTHMLNEIRVNGYWILKSRVAVASCFWKCIPCKKLSGKPVIQKMSDLPEDRLAEHPPFTYSGVDYFGPFYTRVGRSDQKRWGVIFTCLTSRAVHIEVAYSLTTDSFLNAYRRFVCRRGTVRSLRCDRGSNFVGAKGELESALAELSNNQIQRELLKDGTDWIEFKFNVPLASHMSGVWERLIKSVRTALSGILEKQSQQLDDELITFLTEAEAIVNSRPLTYLDMSSTDTGEPLTPSQLLTQKSKVILPLPGAFVPQDLYCRKRWRRVQYLANEFWRRWRLEYLPTLQLRQKWQDETLNLIKGDIVLVIEENTPRCQWPRAMVMKHCRVRMD